MNMSLVARGQRGERIETLRPVEPADAVHATPTVQRRDAVFAEGVLTVDIVPGDTIALDTNLEGPVIIEETTTTIVVPPGWRVRLDGCHAWVMQHTT